MSNTTPHWWLEIGPLKEGNYTGISQVTAALAQCMLQDQHRASHFFYGRAEVPRDVVAAVVGQRHGELLEWYVARSAPGPAPGAGSACNVAIFPNRKTCRRGFDYEIQIIHDLSTLLTPQFHGADTVAYHALSLREDVHSNDLNVCVSDATRDDLLLYLGPIDPAKVVTAPLGTDFTGARLGLHRDRPVEPYVLVLGTVEPRKNISQVLQFLSEQPHLLVGLRFVFLGRYGWGDSIEKMLERHGLLQAFDAGRIVFPGYVSDAVKFALLEQARMLIYPSLFEGFGLPVIEALALGVACLTTRSSSLMQAGGNACIYFDPFTPGDFARGFALALQDTPASRKARRAHAAQFTWPAMWQRIAQHAEDAMERMADHAG